MDNNVLNEIILMMMIMIVFMLFIGNKISDETKNLSSRSDF